MSTTTERPAGYTVTTVASPAEGPLYTVYRAQDHGWVLRDHATGTDYPFHSRDAALAGVEKRRRNPSAFIGSPSAASVYGEPSEAGTVRLDR